MFFSFSYNKRIPWVHSEKTIFLRKVKMFRKKMENINPFEREMELKRVVVIFLEKKDIWEFANDFPNYIYWKRLQAMYANV